MTQMQKSIVITQSNYIPWKGFFDGLAQVDELVVYDDMQYTRRDWRNRNKIKTQKGTEWLSIPVNVKGRYLQKINETVVVDDSWKQSHLEKIKANYLNAAEFTDVFKWIESVYATCNEQHLTAINVHFIKAICEKLNLDIAILDSRDFKLEGDKTEKLVGICQQTNATSYFTGPAAKDYMDEKLFQDQGIQLNYFDYGGYPEYPQQFDGFEHSVSILDLFLNVGFDVKGYMKFV